MTARYRAEPPTGDYPTGPSDSGIDDPDYPAPAGNAGYSPARPYVAPVPGVTRGPAKGAAGAAATAGRKATLLPIPSLMAARPLSPRCASAEDRPAVLTFGPAEGRPACSRPAAGEFATRRRRPG